MWQLNLPGSTQPSYLFGTMHVRDERAYGWFELVKSRLLSCDALFLEVDLSAPPSPEMMMAVQLPPGVNLRQLLGEPTYLKAERLLLKAFQLDIKQYLFTLPMILIQGIDATILKGDRPFPLDEGLFRLALQHGKQIGGLETTQSQVDLLKRIPLDYQVRQLKRVLRSISAHRKSLSRLAGLYEEGRIQQIYRVARKGAGPMRRAMIYQRNHAMTDRLMELMEAQSIFAAVGMGHLPGKEGMLRLLKHRGVQLAPVWREIGQE